MLICLSLFIPDLFTAKSASLPGYGRNGLNKVSERHLVFGKCVLQRVLFSSAFCEPQNNILHYPTPTTHITHNLKTRVGHSTELTSFLGSVCLLLALHYINTSPAVSVSLQPADYFQCDSGNPAKWQIKGQLLEANSFMI